MARAPARGGPGRADSRDICCDGAGVGARLGSACTVSARWGDVLMRFVVAAMVSMTQSHSVRDWSSVTSVALARPFWQRRPAGLLRHHGCFVAQQHADPMGDLCLARRAREDRGRASGAQQSGLAEVATGRHRGRRAPRQPHRPASQAARRPPPPLLTPAAPRPRTAGPPPPAGTGPPPAAGQTSPPPPRSAAPRRLGTRGPRRRPPTTRRPLWSQTSGC